MITWRIKRLVYRHSWKHCVVVISLLSLILTFFWSVLMRDVRQEWSQDYCIVAILHPKYIVKTSSGKQLLEVPVTIFNQTLAPIPSFELVCCNTTNDCSVVQLAITDFQTGTYTKVLSSVKIKCGGLKGNWRQWLYLLGIGTKQQDIDFTMTLFVESLPNSPLRDKIKFSWFDADGVGRKLRVFTYNEICRNWIVGTLTFALFIIPLLLYGGLVVGTLLLELRHPLGVWRFGSGKFYPQG